MLYVSWGDLVQQIIVRGVDLPKPVYTSELDKSRAVLTAGDSVVRGCVVDVSVSTRYTGQGT